MRVQASVKKICRKCKIVRRKRVVRVICTDPRHKQRQGDGSQPSESGSDMARIAGINIPNHQHAEIALTAIFGIGRSRARDICDAAGVKQSAKIKDLTDAEMDKLREQVAQVHRRGRPAPRDVDEHQAPDGPRLLPRRAPRKGLPVRGQRTRTNARTRKGPRKAVRLTQGRDRLTNRKRRNTRMAKAPTAARVRKKVKKNVSEGIAHVHASFNNTIITITDRQGNALSWATSGAAGFKGSRKSTPFAAQVAAESRRPRRAGMRREEPRSAHQGPRPGPRIGRARAERARPEDRLDRRRDAGAAQRLPPAQAAPHVTVRRIERIHQEEHHGTLYRTQVQALEKGRRPLPQEREVLHRQRNASATTRPGQHGAEERRASRTTASSCARSRRSAASTACSSASSAPISTRRSRSAASPARTCCRCWKPPGQRRLPHGVRRHAHRSAPARARTRRSW